MAVLRKLPMLSFDLRRSDFDIDFRSLDPYVEVHFQLSASSLDNEFKKFRSARKAACDPSFDHIGLSNMRHYYIQLQLFRSHFPVGPDSPESVLWKWRESFNTSIHESRAIHLEFASILFNMGALHSKLGSKESRSDPESLKVACTHFQCAYWALNECINKYLPVSGSFDLDVNLIRGLAGALLAQAQECVLGKSMLDNRIAFTNIKLAQCLSEMYTDVSAQFTETNVSSRSVKLWKKYSTTKAEFFSAIVAYFLAINEEEKGNYGVSIAWLQKSSKHIDDAEVVADDTKLPDHLKTIRDDVKHARTVIRDKLSSSIKDNESAYYQTVPKTEILEAVQGVCIVKGVPFDFDDPELRGVDIFQRLVPIDVLESSSLYSEAQASYLREMVSTVESKDCDMVQLLETLHFDPSSTLEPDPPIPQGVYDWFAYQEAYDHTTYELTDQTKKLVELSEKVDCELKTMEEKLVDLDSLAGPLPSLKRGDRMHTFRNRVNQLKQRFKALSQVNDQYRQSNTQLQNVIKEHKESIEGSMQTLEDFVKRLDSVDELVADPEVKKLAYDITVKLDRLHELREQRADKINQLRTALHEEDVTSDLLLTKKSKNEMTQWFEERLKTKHDLVIKKLNQNFTEHEDIKSTLIELNAAITSSVEKINEVRQKRTAQISDILLIKETNSTILLKCEQGVNFYEMLLKQSNDLVLEANKMVDEFTEFVQIDNEKLQINDDHILSTPRTMAPNQTSYSSNALNVYSYPNSMTSTNSPPDRISIGMAPRASHFEPFWQLRPTHMQQMVQPSQQRDPIHPPQQTQPYHQQSQQSHSMPLQLPSNQPRAVQHYQYVQPFQQSRPFQPEHYAPRFQQPHLVQPQQFTHPPQDPQQYNKPQQQLSIQPQRYDHPGQQAGPAQRQQFPWPSQQPYPVQTQHFAHTSQQSRPVQSQQCNPPQQPAPVLTQYAQHEQMRPNPSQCYTLPHQQPIKSATEQHNGFCQPPPRALMKQPHTQRPQHTHPAEEQRYTQLFQQSYHAQHQRPPSYGQQLPNQVPNLCSHSQSAGYPQLTSPETHLQPASTQAMNHFNPSTVPNQRQLSHTPVQSVHNQIRENQPRPNVAQSQLGYLTQPSNEPVRTAYNSSVPPTTMNIQIGPSGAASGQSLLFPIPPNFTQQSRQSAPQFRATSQQYINQTHPMAYQQSDRQFRHASAMIAPFINQKQPQTTMSSAPSIPINQLNFNQLCMVSSSSINHTSQPHSSQASLSPLVNTTNSIDQPINYPQMDQSSVLPTDNPTNGVVVVSSVSDTDRLLQPQVLTKANLDAQRGEERLRNAHQYSNQYNTDSNKINTSVNSNQIVACGTPYHRDMNSESLERDSTVQVKQNSNHLASPLSDHLVLNEFISSAENLLTWLDKAYKPVEDAKQTGLETNGLATCLDIAWQQVLTTVGDFANSVYCNKKRPTQAAALCCPSLNRDQTIVPFDFNRVVLSYSKQNDYINASHISFSAALGDERLHYIIAQAPMPKTIIHYWEMVMQEECEIVVYFVPSRRAQARTNDLFTTPSCASNTAQGAYGDQNDPSHVPAHLPPDKVGSRFTVPGSGMEIRLQSIKYAHSDLSNVSHSNSSSSDQPTPTWTERILTLQKFDTNTTRSLVHLVYHHPLLSADADSITSSSLRRFIDFIDHVHNYYKQQRSLSHPICVVCNCGSNESGIFVTSSVGLLYMETYGRLPDTFQLTSLLCQQRRNVLNHQFHMYTTASVIGAGAVRLAARHNVVIGPRRPVSQTHSETGTKTTTTSGQCKMPNSEDSKNTKSSPVDHIFSSQSLKVDDLLTVLDKFNKTQFSDNYTSDLATDNPNNYCSDSVTVSADDQQAAIISTHDSGTPQPGQSSLLRDEFEIQAKTNATSASQQSNATNQSTDNNPMSAHNEEIHPCNVVAANSVDIM